MMPINLHLPIFPIFFSASACKSALAKADRTVVKVRVWVGEHFGLNSIVAGRARRGTAGEARRGRVRHGTAGRTWLGEAGPGEAGYGKAGMAERGISNLLNLEKEDTK